MKWKPGLGPSAAFFILRDCGRWCICKTGVPPVYTLSRLGGKVPELVCCGSLEHCKGVASECSTQEA